MTNENLDKLREAVEKAGGCNIINLYVDDELISDYISIHEMEIARYNEDTAPVARFYVGTRDYRTSETIWIKDHPALRYEFKNVMDGQHVNIVDYCNGEIATVKR